MPRGHRLRRADLGRTLSALSKHEGRRRATARELGVSQRTVHRHLQKVQAEARAEARQQLPTNMPPIGSDGNRKWVMKSSKDNRFRFAAIGDLHAGSKYTRWKERADLMKRAEDAGCQAIFDTGNWIDGCKPFNIHDLEAVGLEQQCQFLAKNYPKCKVPTYAITGDDHEGWYARSEGIDVGKYCQNIMREAGHDWTNLGYIEADIVLENANTRRSSIMRVMHPGGGSAYAVSYKPQKIIESFEGGEKPAVLLLGHYHKLDFGIIRNVWYIQTGTTQDQTPFLRTRQIRSDVGGFIIECEQDPLTGAIFRFIPDCTVYYDQAYYFKRGEGNDRWSRHGPVKLAPRSVRP